jgi:thioredoxin reductase
MPTEPSESPGPSQSAGPSESPGRSAIPEVFDLAVVGAGPAGLAGAVTAADAGGRVAVLDLSERLGGQYWRWGPTTADGRYHHGWASFLAWRDCFEAHQRAGRIRHLPGHAVFLIDPAVIDRMDTSRVDGPTLGPAYRIHAVADERERRHALVTARTVLVATGAYDRQVPVPGWTRPGVMAAGGVQALLKGSGVSAGATVVVAGTGPFLLPVAAGLVDAGARVAAVVEANDPLGYLHHPRGVAGAWPKLPEAAGYLARLARHRVPILRRHAVIAVHGGTIHGEQRVRSVTIARVTDSWAPVAGTERRLAADVVATGYGFVPQVELLADLGAELTLSAAGTLSTVADDDQHTSIPGLFAAGETTGVGGADLALVEGALAGRAVARRLGLRSPVPRRAGGPLGGTARVGRPRWPFRAAGSGSAVWPQEARAERQRLALRRFAEVIHAVHPVPNGWIGWADETTVVCRCEEVTLGRLRAAVELGADDARSAKLLARPGMGWCQGRMCGLAAAAVVAEQAGRAVDRSDVEVFTHRPLSQPVPLRVLAELD